MALNRTTLTKSLHTVTVVSRVALHLSKLPGYSALSPLAVCKKALELVGQPSDYFLSDDEVLKACVDKLKVLREKGVQV